MRNGCILALSGLAVLFLGGIFGAGYLVGKLDLKLAPRFDTASALAPAAFGRLRIDFDNWPMYRVAQEASGFPNPLLALIMPYEASFALGPGEKEAQCELSSVVSLRRFAGLIASRSGATQADRPVPGVEPCQQLAAGALMMRASLPVQLGAGSLTNDTPLELARQHDIEFIADNRAGLAGKALRDYFLSLPSEREEGDPPLRRGLEHHLASLLHEVQTVQLHGDFQDSGTISWSLRLECEKDTQASAALYYLALLQDTLFVEAMEKGMKLDGGVRKVDSGLEGTFVLEGYEAYAEQWIEAYIS